jgi:hypothetical protein
MAITMTPYEFKPFKVPVWADDDVSVSSDDSDDPEQVIKYIVLKYAGVNGLRPHIDKIQNLVCVGDTTAKIMPVFPFEHLVIQHYLCKNYMHRAAVFKAPPAVGMQSFNGIRQEINSILGSLAPYVNGPLELNIISFDGPYAIATVI